MGSGNLPLPGPAAQNRLRVLDVLRRDAGVVRDGKQERLVGGHVIEHPGEK
jgi:hypothetical protein